MLSMHVLHSSESSSTANILTVLHRIIEEHLRRQSTNYVEVNNYFVFFRICVTTDDDDSKTF